MKPSIQPCPTREWDLLTPAGLRESEWGPFQHRSWGSVGRELPLFQLDTHVSTHTCTQVPQGYTFILLLPPHSWYMCTSQCTSTYVPNALWYRKPLLTCNTHVYCQLICNCTLLIPTSTSRVFLKLG